MGKPGILQEVNHLDMVFALQLFFTKYFQILESGGAFGSLTDNIQT